MFVPRSCNIGLASEETRKAKTWRTHSGRNVQDNARIQLSFNNTDEMEQEEKNESQDDILTKLTNFVDSNLRIFRVSKN